MTDIYMNDAGYNRLIDFMIKKLTGDIFKDQRDALMFALGEQAGIWPESSKPEDE